MPIKFQKHYVTDGRVKARVSYSAGQVFVKQPDGSRELRDCITLYAKDYSDALGKVFPGKYENDTDLMTDYFDEGRVRIFPGDPLHAAAKERCDAWAAYWKAKQEIADAKRATRRASMYGSAVQQVAA